MKYLITADSDWIQGHLRYGHFEGELTEEEYQEYLKLSSEEEQSDFIREFCHLCVDSYEIDDYEEPSNIRITPLP